MRGTEPEPIGPAESLESLIVRMKARWKWLTEELNRMETLKAERDTLGKMIVAWGNEV